MGTIAQKLTYLNDTKGLLKNGINSIGGEITSQTTFRQYATELDSIYASLPKVSGSGSNISLSPTKKGRITSQINGDTFQQTYTGKNLFNKSNTQWYRNNLSDFSSTVNTSTNRIRTNSFAITGGKTYTISGIPSGITLNNIRTYEVENGTNTGDVSISGNTFTLGQNVKYIHILFGGENFTNATNTLMVNADIQIEEGSSATSYEPYVGGTASPNPLYPQNIESVTGTQNINVCGKNLFNKNNIKVGYRFGSTGDYYPNTGYNATNYYISVLPSTTYATSWPITQMECVCLYDKNKNFISRLSTGNYSFTTTNETYFIRADVKDANLETAQIELGSTATTYEAFSGETYTIHLGNIELFEDDYITGTPDNWNINNAKKTTTLKGTEYGWKTDSQSKLCGLSISDIKTITSAQVTTALCDHYTATDLANSRTSNAYFSQNGTDVWFNNQGMDVNTFKTWVGNNNLKLVYELATPTTTPITDTTLINDLNNFYYAMSKNGETNINVDGNLPIILDVSCASTVIATPTETINITSNGTTNVLNYANANVNVQPNLESKEVTITSNTTTNIQPSSGKDGMSAVSVITNVQPNLETKSITIRENTTTTITPTSGKDGMSSVEVITDVSGGGGNDWADVGWSEEPPYIASIHQYTKSLYDNWDADNPTKFQNDTNLVICPNVDITKSTDVTYMFQNCTNLIDVPAFNMGDDVSSYSAFRSMFQSCINLTSIDISNYSTTNWILGTRGSTRDMFSGCSSLTHVDFGNFVTFDISKTNNPSNMFANCTKLDNDTLNQILKLCILIGPNISASNKKISVLGINNTFNNYSNIPNLSNYQDFINAGWTLN